MPNILEVDVSKELAGPVKQSEHRKKASTLKTESRLEPAIKAAPAPELAVMFKSDKTG